MEKVQHEYEIYKAQLPDELTEIEKEYLDHLRNIQKRLKDVDTEE